MAGCTSQGAQGTHNAFGLKTLPECKDPSLSDSEAMHCYSAAAITYAYLKNPQNATDTCEKIWLDFGIQADDDMKDKAAMASNSCYQNIASILADPGVCYSITKKSGPDTMLAGETTSRELCLQQAQKQYELQHYYETHPTNVCTMVYILPLLMFAAFWKK